jgi:hypothetical protein
LALVCWFSVVARVSSDGAGVPVEAGVPVGVPEVPAVGAGVPVVTVTEVPAAGTGASVPEGVSVPAGAVPTVAGEPVVPAAGVPVAAGDGAPVVPAAGVPGAGAIPVPAGAGAGEVVVTGGAGFLGRHLVHLLCSGGWRVTIVDDLSAPHSLSPQLWPSRLQCREAREGQEGGGGGTVRFLQQDCREFFASSESYRHWAAIVHLATRPVSEVDGSGTVGKGEDASSVLARSLQVTGMCEYWYMYVRVGV